MKTVLVTGAAGGIGKAICDVFYQADYQVIGVDRRPAEDTCRGHLARDSRAGRPRHVLDYDIGRLAHADAARESFYRRVEELCEGRMSALVNNAAIQIVKPIQTINSADWAETLDTNLLAPFWLTQHFLPLLRAAKGCVVNIASIHAIVTKAEFTVYSTSKGALVSLTRALAIELAPDVRVNAVIPAATDTPMLRAGFGENIKGLQQLGDYHPLKHIAEPEEVAQIVLFLASPQSSFMTGAAVNVDGGIGACLHDPVVAR